MKFAEKVYEITKKIPKGKVSTYKMVAEALDCKAYRAVGNALNKNKHWPEIPCHRIVGHDGRLTGFARGLKEKARLLSKEGIEIKNGRVINLKKYLYKIDVVSLK